MNILISAKDGIAVPGTCANKFREDVLCILVDRGDDVPISTVLKDMRHRGWRNLYDCGVLAAYLRGEGFTLKSEWRGRLQLRQRVTV